MKYENEDQKLYYYRLSLTCHHAITILTPYVDIKEFDEYLQRVVKENGECHREYFILLDRQLNTTDAMVQLSTVSMIDRPYGIDPIVLSEIRKRKKDHIVDKNTRNVVGQRALPKRGNTR